MKIISSLIQQIELTNPVELAKKSLEEAISKGYTRTMTDDFIRSRMMSLINKPLDMQNGEEFKNLMKNLKSMQAKKGYESKK